MTDIFISYSSQDVADVARIAAGLEAEGFEVWWDRKLQAHRSYGDEIEERLDAARSVLVLWSHNAVRSQWVRSEADRARLNSKLIQASLDGAGLPMPFDQIQCIPLGSWLEDPAGGAASGPGWGRICESVAALKGDGERASGPVAPSRPARSDAPARNPAPAAARFGTPAVASAIGLAILPVAGWLGGIAPPGGGLQTAILVPMNVTIFLLCRHFLGGARHPRVVAAAIALTFATFGAGVSYNLLAQRFLVTAGGAQTVLGCGWRSDAAALVRAQAPVIDAGSQCPGDWGMAAPLFSDQPARLYSRNGLDLVWLAVSMVWGALFMALSAATAALLRLFGR